MKRLDLEAYERLVAGAEVVSKDRFGDKVLALRDGRMFKLFRLKRLVSSAVIRPYAGRFERAARKLRALGVPTVRVAGTFRIPGIHRHAVVYHPLEGRTLREALGDAEERDRVLAPFAAFLSLLHEKGVYFRAVHFGNIIFTPGGAFGLIDVSEVRISRASLTVRKRIRNFRHMLRYPEDRAALYGFGMDRFVAQYLEHSRLAPRARRVFLRKSRQHGFIRNGQAP